MHPGIKNVVLYLNFIHFRNIRNVDYTSQKYYPTVVTNRMKLK